MAVPPGIAVAHMLYELPAFLDTRRLITNTVNGIFLFLIKDVIHGTFFDVMKFSGRCSRGHLDQILLTSLGSLHE